MQSLRAFTDPREALALIDPVAAGATSKVVLGQGDSSPDVMLVKRAPSFADFSGGKPLLGQDGLPIRKALFGAGVRYYAVNAFPFVTPKGKVTIKQARAAAGILAEEIRRVNPERVVLLGADAARWTEDFPVPFRRHNEVLGRIFEGNDRFWRVTKAPGAITNVPSAYREFIDEVRELLVYGTEQQEVAAALPEKYVALDRPGLARQILRGMGPRVAIDIESTGLDPYRDELLTVQLSWREGEGYAFPWGLFPPDEWARLLGQRQWVFQNGTFDVKFLAANGVNLPIHEDTMLMHSLIEETPGTHSMEVMANKYLKIDKWGETVDYDDMGSVPFEVLGRYGARDTDITLRLANVFKPHTQGRYIHELLHRAQNSITRSELRGVRVDTSAARRMEREIEELLHESECSLRDAYGLQNANSPKQVLELLLGLGVPLQRVRGSYSTAEDAISPFEATFPVVRDILNHRHLTKARSTYLRNLLDWTEHDGRYHPEFRLAATETGRVAEKFITLVPRSVPAADATTGRLYQARLRELFVPDPGYVLIGADYSGLELAMAAYLSKDPNLVSDIALGRDTHSLLAIQAFNLDIDLEPMDTLKHRTNERHSHERTLAKQITFGYLFGSSGLSMTKFMSLDDATQLINSLKARYARLDEWQGEVRQQARRGFVETPWGRRRHFYYDDALGSRVHAAQDRECINFPIQGHSSDMNLAAFTRLEEMGYETLFPVHDAIYLQVREPQADRAVSDVREVMEGVIVGEVPFRVEVHSGASWAEV